MSAKKYFTEEERRASINTRQNARRLLHRTEYNAGQRAYYKLTPRAPYRRGLGLNAAMRAGQYKCAAKKRGIDWSLTKERVLELFSGNCHYCGSPPSNVHKRTRTGKEFIYSGLDRVDSSKGYTLDNVVSCCKRCNSAKNDMTVEEFRAWLTLVAKHMNICGGISE